MIDTGLLIVAILVAAGLFVALKLPRWLTRSQHRDVFRTEWQKVEALLQTDEGRRLAIIEADKLLDQALRERGYRGDSTGERLKKAGSNLNTSNRLWAAHKLRNRLVHESGTQLSHADALQALQSFQRGLKELGVL